MKSVPSILLIPSISPIFTGWMRPNPAPRMSILILSSEKVAASSACSSLLSLKKTFREIPKKSKAETKMMRLRLRLIKLSIREKPFILLIWIKSSAEFHLPGKPRPWLYRLGLNCRQRHRRWRQTYSVFQHNRDLYSPMRLR